MNHAERLIRDPIFGDSSRFPIAVLWSRNSFSPLPLNRHREIEIHYIKRGRGRYLIENRSYPFGKNSVITVKPNEIHRYVPDPGAYITRASLYFSVAVFDSPRLTAILQDLPHHLRLSEREATRVESILLSIAEEEEGKDEFWKELVHDEAKRLILLLKRDSRRQETTPEKNPLIEDLLEYIEQNFAQDLTLPSLSAALARSQSHVSRLFKKHAGVGLKQYILERRIVEAKKILEENPNLKVGLIPRRVGFHNFKAFNRDFKLLTGLSPSAYRRALSVKDRA